MKNIFNTLRIVFILIATFSLATFAQSGTDYYFEQGNQAYRDGNYQEAIDWYQKILDTGYESGRLYYNLGNCYYKTDQIGRAILNYEKSKKFLPNDSELQFNLELARLKIIDRIETPPRFFLFEWWDQIKNFYTISQLTNLVLLSYIVSAAILVAFLFLKADRIRKILFSTFIITLILTLFCGYLLFANIHEEKTNQYGIVLSPNVTVLSAPGEGATDVFVLHEGIKIRIGDQRGDWLKIVLPDGKSGWIRNSHVGMI